MDSTRRNLVKAVFVGFVAAMLVVTQLFGADPRIPLEGSVWSQWSAASPDDAGRLLHFLPTRLPLGFRARNRSTQTVELAAGFRGVVARHEGDVLIEPLVVYLVDADASSASLTGAGSRVDVNGSLATLRSTSLGTTLRWWDRGFDAIVTADAELDDQVTSLARGTVLDRANGTAAIRFSSVPRGWRVIAAGAVPPAAVQIATSRHTASAGPIREVVVTVQYVSGYDPLRSAIPVHADAGVMRRTRIRGADAILRTSSVQGFPLGAREQRRLSLSWLERPNVLVSISVLGEGVDLEWLRRQARGLDRISAKRWKRVFAAPTDR